MKVMFTVLFTVLFLVAGCSDVPKAYELTKKLELKDAHDVITECSKRKEEETLYGRVFRMECPKSTWMKKKDKGDIILVVNSFETEDSVKSFPCKPYITGAFFKEYYFACLIQEK